MTDRDDQGRPDPWAYLDEFVAANEVRHRGGQHVGTIRFPLVPSVARELRSIFAAVRAAVEAAHQQEIARVCEFARNEFAENAAERLKLVKQHQQETERLTQERDTLREQMKNSHATIEKALAAELAEVSPELYRDGNASWVTHITEAIRVLRDRQAAFLSHVASLEHWYRTLAASADRIGAGILTTVADDLAALRKDSEG